MQWVPLSRSGIYIKIININYDVPMEIRHEELIRHVKNLWEIETELTDLNREVKKAEYYRQGLNSVSSSFPSFICKKVASSTHWIHTQI